MYHFCDLYEIYISVNQPRPFQILIVSGTNYEKILFKKVVQYKSGYDVTAIILSKVDRDYLHFLKESYIFWSLNRFIGHPTFSVRMH